MLTRCNQCGYENGPNYRFCGMCGAPLESAAPAKAPAVAAPSETKAAPVSGPSFLGLAEEPPRDGLEYLLEDDEPRSSHWRLYLALAILAVAALLIWARWRQFGYPWAAQSTTAQAPAAQTQPAPAVEPPAPLPSEPAKSTAPASAQQGPTITDIPPAGTPPANQSTSASEGSAPPQSESAANVPQQPDPANVPKPETSAAPPKPVAVEKPKPVPPAPAVSADDRLAAEGEKYLYGNGVTADCGRALKNLNAAAAHSNAKAQSLMGAMYATGHCASRDLPTAYRWFAKALHNDPTNVRLESDLKMVWNQMTPGERSLATRAP